MKLSKQLQTYNMHTNAVANPNCTNLLLILLSKSQKNREDAYKVLEG